MENGIILLDKKAGSSSRDLDNLLEKKFQTKKVGHLGTLDPFATGLMVVALNKGTKFLPYLDDSRKSYIATLHLGASSSTLDPEGVIALAGPIPPLDKSKIAETMALFLGKSSQIPPMTSAVKVGGEELYKKAHRGEEIERKPREIEVFSFNLVEYKEPDLVFSVSVSRGTYIRVLGCDLAAKLGTKGYLTSLRRTGLGNFLVADAKTIDEVKESDILDPTIFITTMKHVEIEETDEAKVKNGQALLLEEDYGERVLLSLHGVALAVYHRFKGAYYQPERGLW